MEFRAVRKRKSIYILLERFPLEKKTEKVIRGRNVWTIPLFVSE